MTRYPSIIFAALLVFAFLPACNGNGGEVDADLDVTPDQPTEDITHEDVTGEDVAHEDAPGDPPAEDQPTEDVATDSEIPDPGAVCEGEDCVSLGTAGDLAAAGGYAILAKDGISTVPSSAVTGNVGLSPTARVGLTGWSETAAPDGSDVYSTSAQVVAPYKLYAADYAVPTPANLTAAVLNMEAAYTDAAGRAPTSAATTNVGGGTLTDLTLAPGVYEWGTAVNIPTDLTLDGSATDVWIFKVAGTLDMAADKSVILSGGALPQNIFWQVSGAVTIQARTDFEGIILGQTSITFGNLASINGRLLAQSAIDLDATTVTQP